MPIQLRPKPRARAQAARWPKFETITSIDWLALWGLSIGFCAIVLAGIADFMAHDNIGAAYILVGAAGLGVVVVAGWRERTQARRPGAVGKSATD